MYLLLQSVYLSTAPATVPEGCGCSFVKGKNEEGSWSRQEQGYMVTLDMGDIFTFLFFRLPKFYYCKLNM